MNKIKNIIKVLSTQDINQINKFAQIISKTRRYNQKLVIIIRSS